MTVLQKGNNHYRIFHDCLSGGEDHGRSTQRFQKTKPKEVLVQIRDESSSSEENQLLVTAKWSHHKKAKCRMPECKAVVGDLRRHLRTHVKKKELEEEDLEKEPMRAQNHLEEGGWQAPS